MQLPLSEEEKAGILDVEGHEPCPGVSIEFDREIRCAGSDGPPQHATIFRPASSGALRHENDVPRPCLVTFHGGGYRDGDPNGNGPIAKALALTLGVVTVSASYRLGLPEAPSGTGILEDASHAWNWVQANAGDLGIDPGRVAVEGQSAGCLLAGHLAVGSPWVKFENSARPAACIFGWGPLDFVARWYDQGENSGAEDAIVGPGGYMCHPSLYHQLSALTHIIPGKTVLPPALFIYGRTDPVVHARQGRIGASAWKAAGAYGEELYLPNIGHGVIGDNRPQREHWLSKAVAFSEARWSWA